MGYRSIRMLMPVMMLASQVLGASEAEEAVVATRGGVAVTMAEIDAKIMELPADVRPSYLDSPERLQNFVSNLLLEKQTAQLSEQYNIKANPYFETRLKQAVTGLESREVRAAVLANIRANIPDMNALAKENYLANAARYGQPEQLTLRHVLIKVEGRTEEDAIKLAEQARSEMIQEREGNDDAIVAKYTEEFIGAEKSDGYLRNVREGTMVPSFQEAAFALKNSGDVSAIVKTRYGYHVIRLIERKPKQVPEFESVRDRIVKELTESYVSTMTAKFDDDLRNAPLTADPALVRSLRTRYYDSATGVLPPIVAPEGLKSATVSDQ